MEIEFNTSRIAKRETGQTVARPDAAATTTTATDSTSFTSTATLESQMNNVPAVRADKVDMAKTLLTDPKYPPTELLNRIADLLAIHATQ